MIPLGRCNIGTPLGDRPLRSNEVVERKGRSRAQGLEVLSAVLLLSDSPGEPLCA
jgi:hypothetical protein